MRKTAKRRRRGTPTNIPQILRLEGFLIRMKNVLTVGAPVASVMVGCIFTSPVRADVLNVQNYSFENPTVQPGGLPVSLTADYWNMNGSGDVFQTSSGSVAAGVGTFPNPSPTTRGHLENITDNQAAYIFSDVGNEVSQGLVSAANTNVATTFTAGVQYTLTLALAGAQAKPPATDRLMVGLYYLDAGSNRHEVLSQIFQSGPLSQATFLDFSAYSGVLAANDPAIGQQIFVHLTPLDDGGGEFDVDNIRITTAPIADLIVPHGQTVDLAGVNKTVVSVSDGGLTGGGVVTNNGSGAAQLNFLPNAAKIFTGVIKDSSAGGSGALSVLVNGSGTQTLSGLSTYSGQTTLLTGTLIAGTNSVAGGPGAFGSGLAAILLGNTSGTSFANLLIGGAFTIGQDITVQGGSTGVTTIGTSTNAPGTFTGSVTLNNDLTIVSGTSAAGSIKLTGAIGGSGSLIAAGPGSVILTAANTYAGTTTVNAGALVIAPASGAASVNSLTVNGGVAHVSGTSQLTVNGPLTINAGRVDVDRGSVVVNYGAGNPSPAAGIRSAIISGLAGASGIFSSTSAAHPGTTVGYVDANDNVPTAANLAAGSVVFGYALAGDTGLRGRVDLQDYLQLAAHFHEVSSTSWSDGDFNYDNSVDLQDYLLLAKNFHANAATALKPATLSGRATVAASPAVAVPAGLVNPGVGNLALEVDPTNGHVYLVGNSVNVVAYNSDSAAGLFNIAAGKNPYETLKINPNTLASWNVLQAVPQHIAENVTTGTSAEPFAAFGSATGNYYFDLTLPGSTLWTGTSAQVNTDLAFDWGDANFVHHTGQVINIVPEPTSLGFLFFGAAGILARRRRTHTV